MLRIAFLISGTGTNLQYIIDKINEKELDCVIKMVISDNPKATGLTKANLQGIPSYVLDKNTYGENIGDEIIKIIKDKVDLIVLGGFLSILKGEILDRYKHKIINIHPSLIPKFCGKGMYGIKVHEAVLNSGDKITGCTLHFVSNDVDMGTIILQKSLNITGEESPKTLQEKVLKEEHRCLLEGIRLISEGKV
ncbi:phosphoribosylglycinamide formyltransferase [Clostridium algidicarnis]|uniref:phosphoribosylglycinamide formyltransferase n=1 Tax=Clostridium algidicarnis TaxID=37659 RepID=UPI001C0B5029|nr:phosphoribosylglycinamide formyltransferase [Clostridium algidicarnis]MBU3227531.1 phosphoribosylglycinamide formyltransferase [Clostridium algidicarnis]MBU3251062.1 phosphoribosylglycinamide formyltransferase [Clostridium algidicarnis]